MYFIINEVDGYIKEKNGNKYLIFNSGDKNKEVFKKCTVVWNGIKNESESERSSVEYGKDLMKIKLDTYDNLPLNKILKLHNMTIIIRSVRWKMVNFILKFINIDFKYEPYLSNGCHGLMQKAISLNDVAIIYVKGSAYRIYFWYMSKDDGISIMNNSNLIDKIGVL